MLNILSVIRIMLDRIVDRLGLMKIYDKLVFLRLGQNLKYSIFSNSLLISKKAVSVYICFILTICVSCVLYSAFYNGYLPAKVTLKSWKNY